MANKKLYNGIDISRHQNIVQENGDYTKGFKMIKKSGIDFVIIRIGGSNGSYYKDPKFEAFYKAAKAAGLAVGCYYDTGRGFNNRTNGQIDAQHILTLLEGHSFEYPIYMDIETAAPVYRKGITDAAISFGSLLESKGYFVGIYASDISGFKERLELERIKRFSLWVARYGKKPEYVKEYAIWQKSSSGIVDGIQNKVDLDECTINFPSIIKKAHLNNL